MSWVQLGYGQLTQGLGNTWGSPVYAGAFRISVIGVSITDVGRVGEVEIASSEAISHAVTSVAYSRTRHLTAIPIGASLNSSSLRLIRSLVGAATGSGITTNIVRSILTQQSYIVNTAISRAKFSGSIFFSTRVIGQVHVDAETHRVRGVRASNVATSIAIDSYNRRRLYKADLVSDNISAAVTSGRFTFSSISIAEAIAQGQTEGILRNTSANVIGFAYTTFELPEIPPLIIIGGDVKDRFLGNALKIDMFDEPIPHIPIKPFRKIDKFTEPIPKKRPLGPPTTDTHNPP